MNHEEHKNFIDNWRPEKPMTTPEPKATNNIQLQASANYKNYGGYLGDSRQSGGNTRYGMSTYSSLLIIDHWAIRQNARKASHDSLQARTILKRLNDTIIGNGLKIDPLPEHEILGITREESEEWADNVKTRFNLWAKSKDSDLTARNNFYQNQRFYGWQSNRDGDVFVRFHYSKNKNLINPLQISFIDPNQIRGDEFTFSSGPETQDDGIIKDENGKEKAYKVWINDPQKIGRMKFVEVPAVDEKSGRIMMIHGFDPEWAGQTRGIPEIGHSLQGFQDVTSFSEATIKKAINGASLNFIVQNDQQDPSDGGMSALNNGNAGPPVVTQKAVSTQSPVNYGINGVNSCSLPELTYSESGNMVFGAAQGDKLTPIPSNWPAEHTWDYVDGNFSYQAASVSMPLSIAKMKFDKSHSASRGELGLFADVKEIKQDDYATDFSDLVYLMWLSEEIASGGIKAPGFSDPLLKKAWSNTNWTGKPLPDVDPVKTLQAKKLAIEMGFTDFDKEANLYNGSSGKSNRAKITKQLSELPTDPYQLKEVEDLEPETDDDSEQKTNEEEED